MRLIIFIGLVVSCTCHGIYKHRQVRAVINGDNSVVDVSIISLLPKTGEGSNKDFFIIVIIT